MYEGRHEPLLPLGTFARRLGRHAAVFLALVFVSLGLGTLGYHLLGDLGWVDAILNASMILAGMGPVSPLHSTAAKLFASGYALYSGVVFIAGVGIVAAPVLHRLLHRFHLESDEDATSQAES